MKSKQVQKQQYEKPKMVVQKIKLATIAGQYGGVTGPINFLNPMFGLCCN